MTTATTTFTSVLFILFLILGVSSSSVCYDEICDGGVDTATFGACIQRPVEDGGQGSFVAETMKSVYDNAIEAGVQAGHGGIEMVLKGLSAIKPGADVPNPEGLAMCMTADGTAAAAALYNDAFYWAPNCNLAPPFCRNLTMEEESLGNIGYVVDAIIHGDDAGFHRYAFNDTYAIKTSYQSPTLSTGFKCSEMGWFINGQCLDPLAMTCPTVSERGTRNANQYYGTTETVVVGMQLREEDLAPCLDDGTITAAPTPVPSDTSSWSLSYWTPAAVLVLHIVCTVLAFCMVLTSIGSS